jgi:5-methylcytosine-specific restriction endonuclease McrA
MPGRIRLRLVRDLTWQAVRKAAASRDDGMCLRCARPATDVHHRQLKGMGGTSDEYRKYGLANTVCLCRSCHSHVHAHPAESYESGFLVHSWNDPEEVPLKSGAAIIWLRADGTRTEDSPPLF